MSLRNGLTGSGRGVGGFEPRGVAAADFVFVDFRRIIVPLHL